MLLAVKSHLFHVNTYVLPPTSCIIPIAFTFLNMQYCFVEECALLKINTNNEPIIVFHKDIRLFCYFARKERYTQVRMHRPHFSTCATCPCLFKVQNEDCKTGILQWMNQQDVSEIDFSSQCGTKGRDGHGCLTQN